PRISERVAERSERMRVQRSRWDRTSSRRKVVGGRSPPQLVPERAQLLEELVAREEAPRKEASSALRRIPRPEVLDDGLRVDPRARIARELAHRRRPPQPLRGSTQLE